MIASSKMMFLILGQIEFFGGSTDFVDLVSATFTGLCSVYDLELSCIIHTRIRTLKSLKKVDDSLGPCPHDWPQQLVT